MYKLSVIAALTALLIGCSQSGKTELQKILAEKYFRGIYGCDSSVVDNLASEDITVSYPIFQKIFNKSAIRGRVAVKRFVSHFCSVWTDARIKFHEAVAESDKVVLVWSFQARNVGSVQPGVQPRGEVERWGGITLVRFNDAGKIEAEIGEESNPGPVGRVSLQP